MGKPAGSGFNEGKAQREQQGKDQAGLIFGMRRVGVGVAGITMAMGVERVSGLWRASGAMSMLVTMRVIVGVGFLK